MRAALLQLLNAARWPCVDVLMQAGQVLDEHVLVVTTGQVVHPCTDLTGWVSGFVSSRCRNGGDEKMLHCGDVAARFKQLL